MRSWSAVESSTSGTMLSPNGKVLAGSIFNLKGSGAVLWHFQP
jgi:hypothetical protein